MRTLITGAAGFIGSQLAHRLWQAGDEVSLVDNFSFGSEDNLIFDDVDFRQVIYRKDIRDADFMEELFKKERFERVYHFAAITPLPDCQNNPVEAADVNVKGTVAVLDLIRRYGGEIYFASTSAVYENNSDFPSLEDRVEAPSLLYPSTKYAAEQFCRAFSAAYGIPTVCFRFANVYGPHIDCLRTQPPVMGYIIREFFKGKSPVLHSTGEQTRDFIYVDDLIDLCLRCQKNKGFDVVNVGSQQTISINEIAKKIQSLMGCEHIAIEYRETAHFWANYPELYAEPYPIAEALLEHEVLKHTCLSRAHAKEAYGWEPKTDIDEGIKNTVEFALNVLRKRLS